MPTHLAGRVDLVDPRQLLYTASPTKHVAYFFCRALVCPKACSSVGVVHGFLVCASGRRAFCQGPPPRLTLLRSLFFLDACASGFPCVTTAAWVGNRKNKVKVSSRSAALRTLERHTFSMTPPRASHYCLRLNVNLGLLHRRLISRLPGRSLSATSTVARECSGGTFFSLDSTPRQGLASTCSLKASRDYARKCGGPQATTPLARAPQTRQQKQALKRITGRPAAALA